MQVWRAAARELVKDNVAIVRSDDGRRVTYRELKEASVAYAADWAGAFGFDVGGSLEERGRGKAVGVMALPGAEYCAAMLAAWRLGWIAVPLSPSHPIGELTHAIREAKIEVIFVTDNLIDKVADLESPSCHVRRLRDIDDVPRDRDAASRDDLTASPEPEPDDGALVIFTSGTTGAPKAALHTHASLAAQIDSLTKAWGWSCEDKILHALPLNHVHGIVNAWMCAHANGAQVTFCAKFSATQWWRVVVDWKQTPTTMFMGVPTMYVRLIQAYDAVTSEERRAEMSAAASRLRLCVSGSAAMPVPVAKRWSEIAGGEELLERYGATEIGMALSQPLRGRRVPGRVGHPLPGVEVKIVDGELRVKGPGVFGGYVGRPEATAACFDGDGFFITGDATEYEDENLGGYRIMGRTSVDIIKHGGHKLSALEIESAVLEHPGVGECAVCGLPDDVYGEIVGCVLAPAPASVNADGAPVSPPPTAEELRAFLRDGLASYKAPSVVVVVDAVPRNAMGKVNKRSLVGLFGSR